MIRGGKGCAVKRVSMFAHYAPAYVQSLEVSSCKWAKAAASDMNTGKVFLNIRCYVEFTTGVRVCMLQKKECSKPIVLLPCYRIFCCIQFAL